MSGHEKKTLVTLHDATIRVPLLKHLTLKQCLLHRSLAREEKVILDNINLTCHEGERIGIIGHNGSGKTSLLRAIAGIYPLSTGSLIRQGTVIANLEKGIGLDNELSVRQNIQLSLAVSYRYKLYTPKLEQEILDYAELQEFSDQPLKILSAGMRTRLAFALSLVGEADILLLDEIFATGDAYYIKKSLGTMKQRINNASLMLLVSHEMDRIRQTCNRVLLMEKGRLIADGPTDLVLKEYDRLIQNA